MIAKKDMISCKNFMKCGITGWCLEILFTATQLLCNGDFHLYGQTSLWMFPIYGLAVFFIPVYEKIKALPILFRSIIYGSLIILCEYLTGSLLTHFGVCPWSYTQSRFAVNGLIRLDYFPYWMITGLFYEIILCNPIQKTSLLPYRFYVKIQGQNRMKNRGNTNDTF